MSKEARIISCLLLIVWCLHPFSRQHCARQGGVLNTGSVPDKRCRWKYHKFVSHLCKISRNQSPHLGEMNSFDVCARSSLNRMKKQAADHVGGGVLMFLQTAAWLSPHLFVQIGALKAIFGACWSLCIQNIVCAWRPWSQRALSLIFPLLQASPAASPLPIYPSPQLPFFLIDHDDI